MSKIEQFFYGFIPKWVPARVVLFFADVFAIRGIPGEISNNNLKNNVKTWRRMYEEKWSKADFSKSYNAVQQSKEATSKDSSEEMEKEKEEFNKSWKIYLSFKEKKESEEGRKKSKEEGIIKEDNIDCEGDSFSSEDNSENTSEDFKKALLVIKDFMNKHKELCYIERQPDLYDLKYGMQKDKLSAKYLEGDKLDGSDNTCEVIAAFNASLDVFNFHGLDSLDQFPNMLNFFESRGIVKSGYFGTSSSAIYKYFKQIYNSYSKRGKKARIGRLIGRRVNQKNLDKYEKEYDSFILMSYNDASDMGDMIHTICISKLKDCFKAHNDYEGCRESKSLYDAVFGYNEYKSKPLVIIGLSKIDIDFC